MTKQPCRVSKILRRCVKCGGEFKPNSNSQKFCLACRLIARVEIFAKHRAADNRRKYKVKGAKFFCVICGGKILNNRTTKERLYHKGKCLNQARYLRGIREKFQYRLDIGETITGPEFMLLKRIEKVFKRRLKKDETFNNF